MRMRLFGAVASICLLLTGCYTMVPLDEGKTALMPASVAKSILEKRLPSEWLRSPSALKGLGCYVSKSRWHVISVSMSDLGGVQYFPRTGSVQLAFRTPDSCLAFARIDGLTREEANELANAFSAYTGRQIRYAVFSDGETPIDEAVRL